VANVVLLVIRRLHAVHGALEREEGLLGVEGMVRGVSLVLLRGWRGLLRGIPGEVLSPTRC